jgi:hypothetical protein
MVVKSVSTMILITALDVDPLSYCSPLKIKKMLHVKEFVPQVMCPTSLVLSVFLKDNFLSFGSR